MDDYYNDIYPSKYIVFSEDNNDDIHEYNQLNDIYPNMDLRQTWGKFINDNNKIREDANKEPNERLPIKIPLNQKKSINNDIILNDLTEINSNRKNSPSNIYFGGKKKSSKGNIKCNKYYENNIIRNIKAILLSLLPSFINSIINKVYNGNIGKGISKKQLLKMNQNQLDLKSDKDVIYKKSKDIFSNDISTKFTSFLPNHNKNVIIKLLSENDIEKRKIFENLFSLTFLECIMHIRGTNHYEELEGLESLDDICKEFEDDDEYVELFKYYFCHFEEIIMNKRYRNRNKK